MAETHIWRRAEACAALGAVLVLGGQAGAGAAAPPPLSAPSIIGEPPTGSGVFRFPQAVATSPDGQTVYVADQHSGVVQRFALDGTPLGAFGGRAVRREPAPLGTIGGLATDRAGRVYVLDSAHARVQVFSPTGRFLTAWGRRSLFQLAARDAGPSFGISSSGIAVAQHGASPVVYIADQGYQRVERFRLDPVTLRPVGRTVVSSPRLGLARPQGIAVDPAGRRVYVADDGHSRVVELRSDTLAYVAQTGRPGDGRGQLDHPYDVSVDRAGLLYVADNLNSRVAVFDARTLAPLWSLGGFGRQVGRFAIVRSLTALPADPRGGVIVTDTANDRVQVLGAGGRLLAAWGIAGRGPGYVTSPHGVAVTPGGGIAVADTFDHRIERFHSDGSYDGQLGHVSRFNGFTAGGRRRGDLNLPTGIAYDARGHAWVADPGDGRVVEYGLRGRVLRRIGLPGVTALAAGPGGSVLAVATHAVLKIDTRGRVTVIRRGLHRPVAVAARTGGGLYVATASRLLAPGGRVLRSPGGGRWHQLAGLAYDHRSGTLYVAEERPRRAGGARVLRRLRSGRWQTIARYGAGIGEVVAPSGLAISPDGDTLVVSDLGAQRVLRFDAPGDVPRPPRGLAVSVAPLTGGTVTSTEPGIACPTDCSQHFSAGHRVTLVAHPARGRAVSWGGACASAGRGRRCTVTMRAALGVTVTFRVPKLPSPWTRTRLP
jgi:DNA-binding beta-propeller fold protein YncE